MSKNPSAKSPGDSPGARSPKSPTKSGKTSPQSKQPNRAKPPCPFLCNMVPVNVPDPGRTQEVIHPKKDVFVLKVAKIGPQGDRHCKMELELVTPKGPERNPPCRIDTKETQCEPECSPCCCCPHKHAKDKKKGR